jgi:hypothetical protein
MIAGPRAAWDAKGSANIEHNNAIAGAGQCQPG